jgi:hypothetical protein
MLVNAGDSTISRVRQRVLMNTLYLFHGENTGSIPVGRATGPRIEALIDINLSAFFRPPLRSRKAARYARNTASSC